jgi:uncharacterized protein with PIN domain
MTKKLIALISTEGKDQQEIIDEVRAALDTAPSKLKITQKQKYYCPECQAEVTKVPISNYKNESGKTIHIPHFGIAHCTNCNWKSQPYGRGVVIKN